MDPISDTRKGVWHFHALNENADSERPSVDSLD